MSYLGILGFPHSGQDVLEFLLSLVPLKVSVGDRLHGFIGWKEVLPEFRPTEIVSRGPSKEGRNRRPEEHIIPAKPLIHLMRYPWHAIAAGAKLLTVEELQFIKEKAGIHPRCPGTHLTTWESKVKVLTLAYPKWYDKIREQNPDAMIKIERLEEEGWPTINKLAGFDVPLFNFKVTHSEESDVAPVDYYVATGLAGSEPAGQVEVIAKNLYKRAPVV